MRYMGLDISTNTGYAIFDDHILKEYGVFTRKVEGYKADVKTYKDFPLCYPNNFIVTIEEITQECLKIIEDYKVEMVIIEHPEKGKQRLSQRLLEWTHLNLIKELNNKRIPFKYILVNDWRSVVKCYIKYWPDYQEWNKKVKSAKKKAIPTITGMLVPKIEGKRVSAMNQKKLSILIANKNYDITIKDNNIADAINMAHAAKELGMVG